MDMDIQLKDTTDGWLRFCNPTSSSYFHDLSIISSDGKITTTNKLLFACVSSLSQDLDAAEPDFISLKDVSFQELQAAIEFIHTGIMPNQPGSDLLETFTMLGITLKGKSFKKVVLTESENGFVTTAEVKEEPIPEEGSDVSDWEEEMAVEEQVEESEDDVEDQEESAEEEEEDKKEIIIAKPKKEKPLKKTKEDPDSKRVSDPRNKEGICQYCGGVFKRLFYHIITQHNEEDNRLPLKFTCDKCPKKFAARFLLRKHYRAIHERACCDICGKVCSSQTLKDHKLGAHGREEDRPYVCELCPRRFVTKHQLMYHENRCKDIKPYKCRICNQGFYAHGTRNDHEKRMHTEGDPENPKTRKRGRPGKTTGLSMMKEETQVACETCGKTFKGPSCMYIRHSHILSMHTKNEDKPFHCETCGKGFAQKNILKHHIIRMHTNDADKPFVCNVCGKGFPVKQHFEDHILIHENKKPFKCNTCGAGFNNRGNRNAHERSVHLGIKSGQVKGSRKRQVSRAKFKEEESAEERALRWQEAITDQQMGEPVLPPPPVHPVLPVNNMPI